MASAESERATVDDLYRIDGKAELVAGRIVRFPQMGFRPAVVMGEILVKLHDYAKQSGRGGAYTRSLAYIVPRLASGRESFSPDGSFYDGPLPENRMHFISGPPTVAIEVRGEGDFGPAAEAAREAKREDYFAAGTKVVWDVDPVNDRITSYTTEDPTRPTVFVPGDTADAEPAAPGWRVPVADVFR